MKAKHGVLIFISGLVWFGVGCFLLTLGLKLIVGSAEGYSPFLTLLGPLAGGVEQAAVVVITIALLVGFFKGRFVLAKAVQRGINHIEQFPNPTSVLNIYPKGYYLLLLGMMGLGMLVKVSGLPGDIRGLIDVAIGSALINGAMLYFRYALSPAKVV